MAWVGNLAVNGFKPRNVGSCWILPKGSAAWKAIPDTASMASGVRGPGVGGPFALHIVSSRQPGRSLLLLFARTSMPDKLKKQGRQMATGKSEGCIVPAKPGNSGGGKAAEPTRGTTLGIVRTQSRNRGANPGGPQRTIVCECVGGEPDALTVHVRFWEGAVPN